MKNQNGVVFGEIINDRMFDIRCFGFAECRAEKSEKGGTLFNVFIHLAQARRVVANEEGEPVFSDETPRHAPRQGDRIVAILLESDKPEDGRAWPAQYWGYRRDWEEVLNAPWYRVIVNSRRFNAQFERIVAGTKITDEGKLAYLQSKHPRLPDGNESDRLGTVYKSGPVTEWQSWQRFVRTDNAGNDIYEPCADPRSRPLAVNEAKPVKKPVLALGNGHNEWSPGVGTKTATGNGNGAAPDEVKLAEAVAAAVETFAPAEPQNGKSVKKIAEEVELLALANGASGRRAGTTTMRPR